MSITKAITAVLILTGCLINNAFSQYPASSAFKTLNVTDGLPQSFISGLEQDSIGFIWIGTRDGLAKFDGKKFKIFRHISGDNSTIDNNTINSLYLDRQSRLWIAYETGAIDVLHTQTERLFHLTKDPVYKPVYKSLKSGHSTAEDAEGNIWMLCNSGGLFICNINKRTGQYYPERTFGLQNNKIVGITAHNGKIVLVTDTALVTVTSDKKITQVAPYTFNDPHLFDPANKWKDAYTQFRNNGEIIIQDTSRFIIYHPSTKSFTTVPLPAGKNKLNFVMVVNNKGDVFFDYNNDIYVLSSDDKISIWKPKDKSISYGYKTMLIDRSNVLWLGGNGSGIQLHNLQLSNWIARYYEKNFHEDILKNYLNVSEDEIKKSFLYGMPSYRLRWKRTGSKIWFSKAVDNSVVKPQLCYYENGHLVNPLWYYTDTAKNTHININAIATSGSGKLWGIDFFLRPVRFDEVTRAVTVYPSIASINFENTYTVNSLSIDGENIFWISTALEGLFCYNKQKKTVIHYFSGEAPGALPTNQLMNLVQDPLDSAILWIGSLGSGLIRFNKITGKCIAYTTRNGLPNNTVYAVVADKSGVLWCSSNKGVFSFHPRTTAVRSFTSEDGLPGDEFNRYHFFQFLDGQIAFGGIDGYTVFDPLRIANDTFQPSVALTDIHINNIAADFGFPASPFGGAINSLKEIVLPYNQNFLTFKFAALQYNVTEKLLYRYKLGGFDENWVYAGNENIANYTKIPPGHYTLEVNATNTAGKWSGYIKTLSVTIEPPFWGTWWFIALGILVLVATIYFLVKYRTSIIRKEERQKIAFEKEASELKARALRAQMNPHFIFNCLNSIKALIQEDNKQQAVIYLTTFSKLIRSQLNNVQQEITLHDELQNCRLYTQLEALRFGSKIVCEVEIEDGVDLHSIPVPPLILQPFIENAIWHGILPKGGGKVTVSVKQTQGEIACMIDDNGIGRDMAMRNISQTSPTHDSKGMRLVKNRLNLYNIIHNQGGSIEVIDKKDEKENSLGTLVIVKFKDHLR